MRHGCCSLMPASGTRACTLCRAARNLQQTTARTCSRSSGMERRPASRCCCRRRASTWRLRQSGRRHCWASSAQRRASSSASCQMRRSWSRPSATSSSSSLTSSTSSRTRPRPTLSRRTRSQWCRTRQTRVQRRRIGAAKAPKAPSYAPTSSGCSISSEETEGSHQKLRRVLSFLQRRTDARKDASLYVDVRERDATATVIRLAAP
mmetsp:Transcript_5961/g.11809  ORF Transcript_5961/g.11809 Transcript_5961/m.11809 type:complete len:206 (-) Transcript_5961:143-760(-)